MIAQKLMDYCTPTLGLTEKTNFVIWESMEDEEDTMERIRLCELAKEITVEIVYHELIHR